MIHPDTELRFISPDVGYGVVATKLIPKGTITWAFDKLDRSFTPTEYNAMEDVYKDILYKYCYRDNNGNYVLCWDNSRFFNHSFNSNCISTAYNFELAVKDISPGEEMTNDYGYLNAFQPFEVQPEPFSDRTSVMPDDLLHFYKEWDSKTRSAFKVFKKVNQPLAFLIESRYREKVAAVVKGTRAMDSILNCFYSDNPNLMALKEHLLVNYSNAADAVSKNFSNNL
jgi:hypothetical protein